MQRFQSLILILVISLNSAGVLLLAPQKAQAAAAFVQAASDATFDGTTDSGITTTSGNLLVAYAVYFDDGINCSAATPNISDNKSNSWSTAIAYAEVNGNGYQCAAVYYSYNITGGSGHTVTISASSPIDYYTLIVHEVSGIQTSSDPLDKVASDVLEAGTAIDVGPVTTTTNGQYIFSSVSVRGTETVNADSPMTRQALLFDLDFPFATADYVQSSAGSFTANWTASGTQDSSAFLATFKDAAVAPSAPTGLTTTSVTGGVQLDWSDGGGSPTTYGIYRSTASPATTLIASISSAGTTYTDTTAARGINYYYRVTASNASATSTYSNERFSSTNSGRVIRLGGLLRAS